MILREQKVKYMGKPVANPIFNLAMMGMNMKNMAWTS